MGSGHAGPGLPSWAANDTPPPGPRLPPFTRRHNVLPFPRHQGRSPTRLPATAHGKAAPLTGAARLPAPPLTAHADLRLLMAAMTASEHGRVGGFGGGFGREWPPQSTLLSSGTSLPSPRAFEVQRRATEQKARHLRIVSRHKTAVEEAEEKAEAAWAKQHAAPSSPQPRRTPRYVVMEPRVPLDRCRPPPFRPPPRPPSSSRGAPITPAEWAALPSHIRAAFAHDEVETPSWARGAASCRPASFLTPL